MMLFNLKEIKEAVDLAVGDDGFRSKEVIEILKVDIDKNQSFAASYGIRSVPTLMIFKEGN